MNVSYWNQIAPNYEDEIFNLFRHDKNNKLRKVIRQYASSSGVAADFGSGIGNGLPLMAKAFKQVDAYDLSAKNIRKSGVIHHELDNIQYQRADLSRPVIPKARYDFAICVCCLIMPSLAIRQKVLSNIVGSIKPNGSLLLVVPSLESAALVNSKLIEWNLADGLSAKSALKAGFDNTTDIPATDIRQGVYPIEGVRTKHFGREELLDLPGKKVAGKTITAKRVFKIEYEWDSVFNGLPKSLQTALPWDWALLINR